MPKMKLPGLSKSAGTTFPVWDEGWYLMKGIVATEGESSNGNPQVKIECMIEDVEEGLEQENGKDPIGRKFTARFTFSENPATGEVWEFQIDQFKDFCNAFGVTVTNADNFELDGFIEKTAWVKLAQEVGTDDVKRNKAVAARPSE